MTTYMSGRIYTFAKRGQTHYQTFSTEEYEMFKVDLSQPCLMIGSDDMLRPQFLVVDNNHNSRVISVDPNSYIASLCVMHRSYTSYKDHKNGNLLATTAFK